MQVDRLFKQKEKHVRTLTQKSKPRATALKLNKYMVNNIQYKIEDFVTNAELKIITRDMYCRKEGVSVFCNVVQQ